MPELQLDPKKTALVLIDLQNAIVGMNPVPHTAAQVVENSRKLAEAFRVHNAPVVYVRVDLNDFMALPVDQPFNLGDKPLPAAASEIAPSAGFQSGDILVTKRHWGAFAGTDLEQQLKSRGIDTVVRRDGDDGLARRQSSPELAPGVNRRRQLPGLQSH